MKTILASAYAVNPCKGSEDGMGWNFIYQIARFHRVIAVTRENNREAIEKFMRENPDELYTRMRFVYFDLPYYQRFWKKGSRGAMLYFWLWQKGLPGFVKKQNLQFDIVHNVNFHNDWTPSYLWKLEKPFVWGPVGHHPLIPAQYLKAYSKQQLIKEYATWLVKLLFWKFSPALKKTRSHASHVLCMNSEAPAALRLQAEQFSFMPSVASEDFGFNRSFKKNFTLISVGRFVPLKGFDLSILSFAAFVNSLPPETRNNCRLVLVGSGPEESLLKRMTIENHIENHVVFIDWVKRSQLLKLYQEASVFLFPSHEGAGMVVSEALSSGLPVICLNNSGPGEFISSDCGIAVKHQNYEQTVSALTEAITQLYSSPRQLAQMSANARARYESHFNWNRRGDTLKTIYESISQ